ncbi:MAG: hypothetical protein ACI89U_003064, partial [Gammaproteobacteria bacterium]
MQVMMYTLGDEIAALRSQRRVSEWALAVAHSEIDVFND